MAQPKRKMSHSKSRSRRRASTGEILAAAECPECKAPKLPHRVCPSCGMYKGRQVLTVEADK